MKHFIILFSLLGLIACKQENKEKVTLEDTLEKINIMQNPDINNQNFVSKLTKNVKHYPKEPIYYMRLGKSNCVIEVLVNDLPIHEDYELSNVATPIRINRGILKSGKQKLTYRLYPTGDLMKESYGDDYDTVTTLTDLTSVNIKIIQMDNKGEKKLKDEVVVMQHKSLNDENGNFIASGKPYYEYTFEFEAEVPYELEGWTKGQDLTKLDQELLEKKALEFHNVYQKIYKNQDADALAKSNFGLESIISQVYYKSETENTNLWDEYLTFLKIKNKKFKEINDYKSNFYGDGKIIALKQKSLEYPYRGLGVFFFEYLDNETVESYYSLSIYLYLPKGKNLEDGLYMIE
ncbi:hypothetical protein [Flavobacterium sp. HNIBRBA15423]|uniref:hypothetical protein n=1 Tax=Flavobacterium sp. HNIBRBA15423 TaxID=3458683 RepID=UPI004043D4AB